ncbi:MAG TPA: adenylate/guanylate cyclase domain-containing protein [Aggregatilineaceae bacterium]|nr:adenylate/guanylate cyclase domain-containing protein [Aggregatilineaceae bacterium]
MTTRTLTILLADLVGSSAHVTSIPQDQAVDYLQDAILPIRQSIEAHEGRVIKFTGDGYLATFDSVCQGLRAAEKIRQQFLRQTHTPAGISLDGVRLILNTADVTLEDDDILGDGVALVSRLEKDVPANHVYVTQAVREVADDAEFTFERITEARPRGWHQTIALFELVSVEASYVDPQVFLMITDLHGLIPHSENRAPSDIHQWLMTWGDLHRQAVAGLKGRVRQFIADMALVTFTEGDDAVHGLLNLRALADIYNDKRDELPPLQFKATVCVGDLILTPTGIVGQIVNHTFDLLNATPRGTISIDETVFNTLTVYRERFRPITLTSRHNETLHAYQLIEDEQR